MLIQVAIVDDEKQALDELENCLDRYSKEKGAQFAVTRFTSSVDFLEKYSARFDMVFMDIQLPDYDGVEVMKKLRVFDKSTVLVYVTNMANFAIKCYEVGAVDFIVKPLEYYFFSVKMDRILKRMSYTRDSSIRVKMRDGFVKLFINSISSVEVYGHDIVYHTDSGDLNACGTLKSVEDMLGPRGFARCSNCFLVNIHYINRIEGNNVYLRGDDRPISISRTKKKSFMQAVERYM